MQIVGDIFNTVLLQPMINLVVFILRVLEASHVSGALGLSIVVLTVIITVVTWPFRNQQIRATKDNSDKMSKIKAEMEELKLTHKDDKLKLSQAQNELYKKHGINPAAGCLPSIISILLIIPLYQVINAFFEGQHGLEKINYFLYDRSWRLNSLPDLHFLGVNLASKPWDLMKTAPWIVVVPVLTALLQIILSKMMAPSPVKSYPSDSPKEKKEKETTEDAMASMQNQMMLMMPLMIGYFSLTLPAGLSIYWNTLNILTIWQYYLISGWGGLGEWVKSFPLKRG